MIYILQLINNPIVRSLLKYLVIIITCLTVGYIYGSHIERNKQLEQTVKLARDIYREKEKIQTRNNQILADKERILIQITKDNAELRGKLKQNEKHINNTNVIRNNFVRSFEPAYSMPKPTTTVINKINTSDELRAVPAADVAGYIIYLREHDAKLSTDHNALIDSL